MRQFFVFLILIFSGLGFFYFRKSEVKVNPSAQIPVLKIYANSSFVAKWGPGPDLQKLFQEKTGVKVELVESSDLGMTLQKIAFENEASLADVVLGIDQFDVVKQAPKIRWRPIVKTSENNYQEDIANLPEDKNFIPYDWAPMTFIGRQDDGIKLEKLDDLLKPELKGKIALEDPRTSSPGLQFLAWVFENKSADDAKVFLKSLLKQVHSYSPSWSTAYGLFTNKQADVVFSYVTSPIYHVVEEKNSDYISYEFAEPLPVQVEFAGVPATCKNCEQAENFVNFLNSPEAQKIIMKKNYMFPVIKNVKEGTPFDTVKIFRTKPVKFYDARVLNQWVEQWSQLRSNDAD